MNMEELPPSTLRQRRHPRDHDNNPENSDDENAFPAPLHDTISYPLYLDPSTAKYHIFFIPGNPGLISYYDTFLSLISAHLNSNEQQQKTTLSHPFSVYGRSLGGFEVSDTSNNDIKEDSSSNSNMMVYSLQEQIDFMARLSFRYRASEGDPGRPLGGCIYRIRNSKDMDGDAEIQ
ncbi:MAG: hypothetical protein M1834_000216 [Cirrosporium novae-zelandiae]|nr:MAG: hypothetical protein M1834_000216 [Cirrosporium novae-zelandiae]